MIQGHKFFDFLVENGGGGKGKCWRKKRKIPGKFKEFHKSFLINL
jgi:hypothetical protein